MPLSLLRASALLLALSRLTPSVLSQNTDEDKDTDEGGYIGYRLTHRGDPESAIYETANTGSDDDLILPEDPDVYLNASVSVGLIDIEVDNITAKVNLDAKVLSLLHFSAGVDASIDRVKLRIENVSAKVELEARLENVVAMVDDVLRSIDLNPIIATLGEGVGKIVDGVGDVVGGGGGGGGGGGDAAGSAAGNVQARDVPLDAGAAEHDLSKRVPATGGHSSGADHDPFNYNLEHNILYSVNDYQGNRHRNRRLDQNGEIFDEYLDNDGNEQSRTVVGYYKDDMTFNGHNRSIEVDGKVKEFELQYEYKPFPGIEAISWIYVDAEGKVVRTKVISEAQGGGTSTVSNDSEE
ncbi:hypothetical protein B0H65DRAFT_565852 [Neurospora tetraspora]|uniref:Uncharacterized protein n=1 Tax=Neurospora tetraspora TaxID=94610 RepID=A0AAE0J101_9PEZI|nr:hypothetical protein B0H65DRAFT_565852 [Neurospora tetraspora]